MAKLALVIPVGLLIGGAVLPLTGLISTDIWTILGGAGSLAAGALIGRWAYPGKWWVAALAALACLAIAWIGLYIVFVLLFSQIQMAPAG